jgi:FkbM family methyltransferase
MSRLRLLLSDIVGVMRICGVAMGVRFALAVFANLPAILRRRNLQPADVALGTGPFLIKLPTCPPFRIQGERAVSGIREMYVRDCYLGGGALAIRDGDVVVDLGANMGNFTNMALAHGEKVRVVSVEPNLHLNGKFETSLGLNPGFRPRATLIRGFLGEKSDSGPQLMETAKVYAGAPWMTEDELIEAGGLDRVDFLKCDIEGGEYGLLGPHSRLLKMTRSLAIEIHSFAGDVDGFIDMLRGEGFAIRGCMDSPEHTVILLAERA